MAAGLCEAACAGDLALLQHSRLTTSQVIKMRDDLSRLPKMPKMVDKLNEAERFKYLDMMMDYSREGIAFLIGHEVVIWPVVIEKYPIELKTVIELLVHHSASIAIDWDIILRMGNSWFDRIVDAYRKPTRFEQTIAINQVEADFSKLKQAAEDVVSLNNSILHNPRKALSERLGQVLLIIFGPSIMAPIQIENQAIMRFELDKLSFALTAYRTEHGSYPAKLSDLVPKYVTTVSKGIFDESQLRYRQEGDRILLYSFGNNGKDDGARSHADCTKDQGWDDLVIQIHASTVNARAEVENE